MLYAKINVKSNHFLFLTSLESPLHKGGSEGVWKYRWLHMVNDTDVKVDQDIMVKQEFIEVLQPLAPQVTTGISNIRKYINEAWYKWK